jgi:hypothetical protein
MRAFIVGVCFVAIGCGGAVADPFGDGGGSDGGGGTEGGGGCMTLIGCQCGMPTCVNGQWACPKCADPCAVLLEQIKAAKKELQSCCPSCKSVQCQGVAVDVCCEITTNGGDKSAFETLVKTYTNTCKPACPDIVCPMAPSGICDPDQGSQTIGRCR